MLVDPWVSMLAVGKVVDWVVSLAAQMGHWMDSSLVVWTVVRMVDWMEFPRAVDWAEQLDAVTAATMGKQMAEQLAGPLGNCLAATMAPLMDTTMVEKMGERWVDWRVDWRVWMWVVT